MNEIDVVFFDIGNTLGQFNPETGVFQGFPDSVGILTGIRQQLGVRIGIITTLGSMANSEAMILLEMAGLADHIDRELLISEHDAGVTKPMVGIYRFAASKANKSIDRCMFIGENLVEIIGAQNAGMKAILKVHLT